MFTQIPNGATHSSLDLFQKPPVLLNFDCGQMQQSYPLTGIDGPTIEFELRTDRNVFLDMQNICLKASIQLVSLPSGTPVTEDSGITLVNNTLHSLFSNCEVTLNGEVVSTSNALYAHKSFITTEWSHPSGCKNNLLACQGYSYEKNPDNFNEILRERGYQYSDGSKVNLFGRLAVDFFNCDKLLIPKSVLRIKLVKNDPNFFLLKNADASKKEGEEEEAASSYGVPKDTHFGVRFFSATLFSRQMVVSEPVYASVEKALLKSPACYTFTESTAKTFIIPAGQNHCIRENIFNGRPIRNIAIAMNTNDSFNGDIFQNPFSYKSFGLKRVAVYRNANRLVDLKIDKYDLTGSVQVYYTTLKSLHFNHDGPDVDLEDYDRHFIMVFDLTSTLQSNAELYYPELTGGQLRLELNFDEPLQQAVEVLVLGEILNTVYVKENGDIFRDG